MIRSVSILVCLIASCNASAHWTLNNDFSQLSFVTVKAGNVGEVHKFRSMAGELNDEGSLAVEIQLASVDTLIPIRDERMQEMLFETDVFPVATFNADLDMSLLDNLAIGSSAIHDITGTLTIREASITIMPRVVITRTASRQLLVNTLEPLILNADAIGLGDGVEKLREVAGLPSISTAVPVTFVLTFNG